MARIPIPIRQRLLRARYRLMPVLAFALAVAGTVMLWGRHTASPNAFGAVDAIRYDITSVAEGVLLADSIAPLDLFTRVEAGQAIARVDDTATRHALAALRADLEAARGAIAAARATAQQEDAIRAQDQVFMFRRLALDMEAIRLDLIDRQVELETEKITLERSHEQFAMATRLRESNAETELGVMSYKLARDVAAQRVAGLEKVVKEAQAQYAAAEARFNSLPKAIETSLDPLLAPLQEAAIAAEARLRELEATAHLLTIRAPVAGTIAAIHKRPGQLVRPGEVILTITDPTPRRIVSYVRADQRITPRPGMEVVIRSRIDPTRVHTSKVIDVGAQVELIPPQHLRSPSMLEWGLPVGIELPPDAPFQPGEFVDLSLRR